MVRQRYQSGSPRCYLRLITISMKKNQDHLIHSTDIDDQRILKSDWMRGTTGHTI